MTERYISLGEISGSPDLHMFRGIIHTKSGVKLRKKGALSYTTMRELLLQKLEAVGQNCTAYTACAQEEQLLQPMQECPTDYLRDMGVGVARMQKTGMLKIPLLTDCQSPRTWSCDLQSL